MRRNEDRGMKEGNRSKKKENLIKQNNKTKRRELWYI